MTPSTKTMGPAMPATASAEITSRRSKPYPAPPSTRCALIVDIPLSLFWCAWRHHRGPHSSRQGQNLNRPKPASTQYERVQAAGRWHNRVMKTYGQFCPIARASEILAERWTPIILRNLFLGCTTFNEIAAGAPLLSRALLTKRLRELERVGVIEISP